MRHYSEYVPRNFTSVKVGNKIECTTIFTFDIETTSFFVKPSGETIPYDKSYTDDEYTDFKKGAVCYIWQFGINDDIYYGRNLSEFPKFLDTVSKNVSRETLKYVWVHNLSFEWQFIREYLSDKIISVFARKERKPIKFNTSDNWEFRCSYMLTRLSLANWGKQIGFDKLSGVKFDYNKIRTPLTKLSAYEFDYAATDCLVVYHGIQKYVEKYGSQTKIPLTQTGEVRVTLKSLNKKHPEILRRNTALLPRDNEEYTILRSVFHGGSCGAYNARCNEVMYNVGSMDIASSYPYVMATQKFPCTRFTEYHCYDSKRWDFSNYAYIFFIKLNDVKARTPLTYWSKSYCFATHEAEVANGKIVNAKQLVLACTEQDFTILRKVYSFKYEIIKLYRAKKGYANNIFVRYIQNLFYIKTTLDKEDRTESEEALYLAAKQEINSLYGCCVMDLIQNDVIYDEKITENGGFITKTPLYDDIINDKLKKPYNNIFAYSMGCWVTAYARARLYKALLAVGNSLVYYDTDSCKAVDIEKAARFFYNENRRVQKTLDNTCERIGLEKGSFTCMKPSGKVKTLGYWEKEETCEEFKTLGAKKYCFRKHGKIGITVAGVPKKYGALIKNVSDFKNGLIFDRDAEIINDDGDVEKIAKNLVTYCDGNTPHVKLSKGNYDEYTATQQNSICMKPTTYELSIGNDYKLIIEKMKGWLIK